MNRNFTFLLFLAIVILASPLNAAKKKEKHEKDTKPGKVTNLNSKEKKDIVIKRDSIEKKSDLKKNVKSYKTAYSIDCVPMIDQGNRPTCAPCTVHRLLDYYAGGNAKVESAALEKAMGYKKDEGTNIGVMLKGIERYAKQLKMNCETLYYAFGDDAMCSKYLYNYNKSAPDKSKFPSTSPAVFKKQEKREEFFMNIDYEAWKHARMASDKQQAKAMKKKILDSIKAGYPLIWCVTLGLYKEHSAKTDKIGGHCRLIIGIDPEKDVIYYSDSWGSSHKRKRMSWEDAWAITDTIMLMKP